MDGHVSAETFFSGFRHGRFLRGLFPGSLCRRLRAVRAGGPVDGLQGGFGSHRRAGKRFDAVLPEGEGSFLADELVRKRRFGSPFAQAFRLVRRVDGQRLHCLSVQGYMDGHVSAETFFSGFRHGRFLRGLFPGSLCRRLRGYFRSAFLRLFRRFRARCPVDGLQGGLRGHRRTGKRLDAVLPEGERGFLADKLIGKGRFGGPFAQALRLVRCVDGQRFHRFSIQGYMDSHVSAEALFSGIRGDCPAHLGRIIHQRLVPVADQTDHRQHRKNHQNGADRDPDPLFLLKIIHFHSSVRQGSS